MAHVLGIESSATWARETSIVNGLSLAGRITTVDNVNLVQCIVECYMDKSCITVGVSESLHGCQLYDLDLEGHKHMTAQMDTFFYKCKYTGLKYLLLKRNNTLLQRIRSTRIIKLQCLYFVILVKIINYHWWVSMLFHFSLTEFVSWLTLQTSAAVRKYQLLDRICYVVLYVDAI